ncbi:hypothetical protein QBZ16_002783 [Prototheca wickerhamii]|uniref:PAP/OAS1 substrate-binding-related domain-containing protein n=1 Tax=Prototheca wickerhamii TaxID=3111 RepID=A0AAD9IK86_PROWI|nr:hypothetical protein QBZ16_002783 [Prototheca wickerhamii]
MPTPVVEAFMFGSVPLRTYLPDGDVDISLFCKSSRDQAAMRGAWAGRLLSALQWETRRGPLHLPIQDVQIIQAEVQLVKCIVAGVVVDISFDTIGGLCTVAFLESVDRLLGRGHLFKRSILLIKAWCYYESRLLGAHHGLLSSYALETMVLNVINRHHSILRTPLQVLMQFLETYSSFDWETHGLSLQGTVVLDALPELKVIPAAMSQAEPLLSPSSLAEMLARYAVPTKQPDSSFPRRNINIFDPLLPSNNLGRSVSKASAARFAAALRLGLSSLRRALERSPAGAIESVDGFFRNAWQAPMRAAAEAATYFQGLAVMSASAHPSVPRPSATEEALPEGALPQALATRPAWAQQRAQRSFQATAPWSPVPRPGGLPADVLKSDLRALEGNLEIASRPRWSDGAEAAPAEGRSRPLAMTTPPRSRDGRTAWGPARAGASATGRPAPGGSASPCPRPPSFPDRQRAPTILSSSAFAMASGPEAWARADAALHTEKAGGQDAVAGAEGLALLEAVDEDADGSCRGTIRARHRSATERDAAARPHRHRHHRHPPDFQPSRPPT